MTQERKDPPMQLDEISREIVQEAISLGCAQLTRQLLINPNAKSADYDSLYFVGVNAGYQKASPPQILSFLLNAAKKNKENLAYIIRQLPAETKVNFLTIKWQEVVIELSKADRELFIEIASMLQDDVLANQYDWENKGLIQGGKLTSDNLQFRRAMLKFLFIPPDDPVFGSQTEYSNSVNAQCKSLYEIYHCNTSNLQSLLTDIIILLFRKRFDTGIESSIPDFIQDVVKVYGQLLEVKDADFILVNLMRLCLNTNNMNMLALCLSSLKQVSDNPVRFLNPESLTPSERHVARQKAYPLEQKSAGFHLLSVFHSISKENMVKKLIFDWLNKKLLLEQYRYVANKSIEEIIEKSELQDLSGLLIPILNEIKKEALSYLEKYDQKSFVVYRRLPGRLPRGVFEKIGECLGSEDLPGELKTFNFGGLKEEQNPVDPKFQSIMNLLRKEVPLFINDTSTGPSALFQQEERRWLRRLDELFQKLAASQQNLSEEAIVRIIYALLNYPSLPNKLLIQIAEKLVGPKLATLFISSDKNLCGALLQDLKDQLNHYLLDKGFSLSEINAPLSDVISAIEAHPNTALDQFNWEDRVCQVFYLTKEELPSLLSQAKATSFRELYLYLDKLPLNEMQCKAYFQYQGSGLTRNHLKGRIWFDDQFHVDAFSYLITQKGMNVKQTLEELHGLDEVQARAIVINKLTRQEVIHFGSEVPCRIIKFYTLADLKDFGMTVEHIKRCDWTNPLDTDSVLKLLMNQYMLDAETSIAELKDLNPTQIHAWSRHDVTGVTTRTEALYITNDLQVDVLKHDIGFKPINFKDADWFNSQAHFNAAKYLVRENQFNAQQVMAELHDLNQEELLLIVTGITREEILQNRLESVDNSTLLGANP